jgi:hypothetical protein
MRTRVATLVAVPMLVAGLAGQSPAKKGPSGQTQRAVPRMPDGHPDLQGTYDLGTLTPLERTAGSPLVLTEDQAKKLETQVAQRNASANAPIDANRAAPPKGGDGTPGPYGNVGGYNNFWLDPGSHYTMIDGQRRASLLIDPPDGRVPGLTDAARQRRTTGDSAARPTPD